MCYYDVYEFSHVLIRFARFCESYADQPRVQLSFGGIVGGGGGIGFITFITYQFFRTVGE